MTMLDAPWLLLLVLLLVAVALPSAPVH